VLASVTPGQTPCRPTLTVTRCAILRCDSAIRAKMEPDRDGGWVVLCSGCSRLLRSANCPAEPSRISVVCLGWALSEDRRRFRADEAVERRANARTSSWVAASGHFLLSETPSFQAARTDQETATPPRGATVV
jgi:hypothetical protein